MRISLAFAAAVVLLAGAACADGRVWLDELSLNDMMCGWKSPRKNKSVEGGGLQIGSKKYERGVGTHAESIAMYDVGGKAISFDADVGIDAEVFPGESGAASISFAVIADGRRVAETAVLKGKREPVHLHADLTGAKTVELLVTTAGDGDNYVYLEKYCGVRWWAPGESYYPKLKKLPRPTKKYVYVPPFRIRETFYRSTLFDVDFKVRSKVNATSYTRYILPPNKERRKRSYLHHRPQRPPTSRKATRHIHLPMPHRNESNRHVFPEKRQLWPRRPRPIPVIHPRQNQK